MAEVEVKIIGKDLASDQFNAVKTAGSEAMAKVSAAVDKLSGVLDRLDSNLSQIAGAANSAGDAAAAGIEQIEPAADQAGSAVTQAGDKMEQAFTQAEGAADSAANGIKAAGEKAAMGWEEAGEKIERTGERITRVGSELSKLSLPVAALGFAAVTSSAKMEEALLNVSTLIKGDATQVIAELKQGVVDLMQVIPKSADDLGGSLYEIYSSGISNASDALKTLEATGKLATAGLGQTAEATTLMTVAINAFGLDASKSDQIANTLFKTVKLGITTVSQLYTNFGQVAGQAAAVGVSFEDVMAATAAMTTVTGKTAESQTQLAALFKEIGDANGQFGKGLKENGMTLENFRGLLAEKGLGGALETTRNKLKLTDEQMKNMFGSAEAGFAAFSLLTSASNAYETALDDIKGGSDDLTEAFNKQVQGATMMWQLLKNRVNIALIQLGDKILPMILPIIDKVGTAVVNLGDWFANLSPGIQKAIIIFGGFIAVLGPVVLAIGAVVTAIGSIVSAAGALGITWAAIGAAVPYITAVIAAIALLGAAWANNWGDIQGKTAAAIDFISGAFDGIVSALAPLGAQLMDMFSMFGDMMGEDLGAAFETVSADISVAIDKIMTAVGPLASQIGAAFQVIAPYIVPVIQAVFGTAYEILKWALTGMYNAVKTGLGLIVSAFELLSTVGDIISSSVSTGLDSFINILTTVGATASSVFTSIIGVIQSFIGSLTSGFTTAESNVVGFMDRATAAIMGVASWLGFVLAPLAELAAWFGTQFGEIYALIADIFNRIGMLIVSKLAEISAAVLPYIILIVQAFTNAWEALVTITTSIYNSIAEAISTALDYISSVVSAGLQIISTVFLLAWESISSTVSSVMSAIGLVISAGLDMIVSYFTSKLQPIVSAVISVFNQVKEAIQSALESIKSLISSIDFAALGRRLMQTLANGIKAGAMFPITAIKGVLSKVRSYLPGSDAEVGPLSDITASGAGMMEALGDGITQGTPETMNALDQSMARIDALMENNLSVTADKLSQKELEKEEKSLEKILDKREEGNLSKIAQMEKQAAEEIALAQKHGKDTAELETYWRNKISEELGKVDEKDRKRAEDLANQRQEQQMSRVALLQKEYDEELALLEKFGEDTTNTQLYYEKLLADERTKLRENDILQDSEYWQTRSTLAGGFANLMQTLYEATGEQSMALFTLQKGFAIGQALINAHLAATKALAEGGPIMGPVMAAVIYAQGVAEVAAIAAQKPKMAAGGIVTRPTEALIGEAGPEAVIPLDRFPMGGMSNSTFSITFTEGIGQDPQTLRNQARLLSRYIREEQGR